MVQVPAWLASAFRGVPTPVADAAVEAPLQPSVGWRWVGMFYSAIPDPEIPYDPAILRAIRTFDPEFIPLVVRWVFQYAESDSRASQVISFKRHGVGRYVRAPKTDKLLFHVDMPQSARFPPPNQIDRILEKDHNPYTFSTQRFDSTLPGEFVPFSWDLFYNPWVQLTPAELKKRYIEEPRARMEREAASRREEDLRKKADLDKYVQKQLDKMGEPEIRMLMRRRRAGLPLRDRPTRTTFVMRGDSWAR